MRDVVAFFILWLALVVQSTVFQIPPISVVQPDLVLIVVVLVAMTRGARAALVLGILVGFVQDANFGMFLGLYAFTYGVIGYFSAAAVMQFLSKNVAITFFITVVVTFIYEWLTYGMKLMFGVVADPWTSVLTASVKQMIVNGITLLILYPLLHRIFTMPTKSRYRKRNRESIS